MAHIEAIMVRLILSLALDRRAGTVFTMTEIPLHDPDDLQLGCGSIKQDVAAVCQLGVDELAGLLAVLSRPDHPHGHRWVAARPAPQEPSTGR